MSDQDRRLLLFSYHFPPGAAVGALRWERFARLAETLGWNVDVIAANPPSGARRDESRLTDLPSSTRVYTLDAVRSWLTRLERWAVNRRARGNGSGRGAQSGVIDEQDSWVPSDEVRWGLHRLLGWRRAYNAWRHYEQDWEWADQAAALGHDMAQRRTYDAVISSGPPHLAHVAAARVAIRAGIPLAVDFRDPWSQMPSVAVSVASPVWLHLGHRLEREALTAARLIVANTDLAADRLREAYPEFRERVLTVMNGTDEEPMPAVARQTRFVVAYTGSIYIDRDPRMLFRAAARLVRERGLTPSQFSLEFMGQADRIQGRTVEEIAEEEGVGAHTTMSPSRPRRESLELLSRASLLVCLPQSTALSIPSKVFEYMLFEAWHLILAEPHTATARLLRDTEMAVVAPNDVDEIYRVLADRYGRFARGERAGPLHGRERFSREAQAKKFFDALAGVIGSRPTARE
jgi:hypothetical protein